MINCFIKNSKITLNDNDFLTEGGEGKIYIKGGTVYKIFFDPKQMIPTKKINELSVLKSEKQILGPKEIIFSSNNIPIGFTMDYVSKTAPLAQLFTTSFRDRYSIQPKDTITLVENIMKIIQFIHNNNILIVDGNEFNYLVDNNQYVEPYFIDVNCWQTPSFPATAIMDSIRDWTTNKFTKESDWFGFAIIACQLFVGMHPFKGKHPNFKKGDLKSRIQKNVSIFNKNVTTPPVVRSFDLIPTEFRNWFIDLFEKGKRTLPPAIVGKIIAKPQITMIIGTNKFDIKEIFKAPENILGCNMLFGNNIIFTDSYIIINKTKYSSPSKTCGIILENNNPLVVDIINDQLSIKELANNNQIITSPITAEKFMIVDNRLYIKNKNKFTEMKITNLGKLIVSPGTSWNVLPNATKILKGILFSNVLGKIHFYIPYKENACAIIPVHELNGYKIFDAKYQNGIVVVIGYKNGIYDRMIFKLDSNFNSYIYEIEKDTTPVGVNFVSLPNGNCVILTGEDTIEITNRKIMQKKVLTNVNINPKTILVNSGNDVYLYNDNILYSFRMR